MSKGTLYGFALSPYVRAVRVVLAEKGIAHDHEPHGFEDLKTAAFGAINPFRKIPAWVGKDGFVVYETPAILRFLDESEPGVSLTPEGVRERATMAQWVGVVGSFLYPAGISRLFLQRVAMPLFGGTADEAVVTEAAGTTAGHLDVLEAALAGPWLAGLAISQADILVGTMLDLIDLAPEGAALVAARPKTQAFLARLRARQNFCASFPEMLAAQQRA